MSRPFSSLELLESRIAPAGVITVELDKDGLGYVITGDNDGNELEVTQNGTELTFSPKNGTEILNKTVTPNQKGTTDVVIKLLGNSSSGRLKNDIAIKLGTGADVLTLNSLMLPDDLSIEMEPSAASSDTNDQLTISGLQVGRDLDITAPDGSVSILGSLSVGLDMTIFSGARTFTADVASLYVGNDLEIDAVLSENTDTFVLSAESFVVYDDLRFRSNIHSESLPLSSVALKSENVFSVGGDLEIQNDGTGGETAVLLDAGFLDVSGVLWVDNYSDDPSEPLSLVIDADVIRLNDGLEVYSLSTESTAVTITAGVAIIDGTVNARFLKSDGRLSIVSDHLTINGNVNFTAWKSGILKIEGDGTVFGKINASLRGGEGDVAINGKLGGDLAVSTVKITTPKAPADADGVKVALSEVTVLGKVNLSLSRGDNTIDINDLLVLSRVSIATGGGSDTVNIHTEGDAKSEFFGGLKVSLGGGSDSLTLGREQAANDATALFLYGKKTFNGGAGSDLYTADNRNVKFLKKALSSVTLNPVVRAFEQPTVVS